MHDPWTLDAPDAREMCRVGQQRIDQRSGGIARTGMDHHACRLVDHQQIDILIEDIERNRLREYTRGLGRRQADADPIAGANAIARFCRASIH
jgi:hypothetical protein